MTASEKPDQMDTEKGKQARARLMIKQLSKKGLSPADIAQLLDLTEENVLALQEKSE